MKVFILCLVVWVVGYVNGILITEHPIAGVVMCVVSGILIGKITIYFERRMKCKNS